RSKPAAPAASLSGTGELLGRAPEALDPGADFLRPRLERRAVDDEARGDVGDALDLDEAVRLERPASRDEVDDAPAEAEAGGELHGARELDAFGLHAARREVTPGDLGIFG